MLGVGVGIGVSNIRRDLPIPNKSDIIRYFKTQEDNILIDKFGNGGDKILPVSVFNGVDGNVVISNSNDSPSSLIYECVVTSYDSSKPTAHTLFNTSNESAGIGGMQLRINIGGSLSLLKANVSLISSFGSVSNGDHILFNYNLVSGEYSASINGIEVVNDTGITDFNFNDIVFFSKISGGADEIFEGGSIDLRFCLDSIDIFIPLPHLGYGFDSSNNPIPLTVSGGVSLGYDINGSSYLQDKGAVERNPELVVDNYFNSPNDWEGTAIVANNEALFENETKRLIKAVNVANGENYELTYVVSSLDVSGGDFELYVSASGFGGVSTSINKTLGKHTVNILCLNENLPLYFVAFPTAGSSMSIDFTKLELATPEIIPNTPTGQPAYPIVSGDTFIAGGGMMNLTDCLVRLYELGDTDPAKLFFDLSNVLIWNDRARQDYYDTNNTGDIHTSILKQAELYLTFEAAYKYRLWSKINSNGVFKDIFLYANQLQGENICLAKRYVGVGEIYTTIEDDTLICRNDIIE